MVSEIFLGTYGKFLAGRHRFYEKHGFARSTEEELDPRACSGMGFDDKFYASPVDWAPKLLVETCFP